MNDDDRARLRAKMDEARQRKQDYDRAHPHPARSQTRTASAAPGSEMADHDPQRARDALDAPTRKRSQAPRTGDG